MTENKLMVNANTKEYIQEYLFIENGEINIGQAQKVLSVSARAVLMSVETMQNEFRANICTTFKVIYLSEDGICSMEDKVESNRSIINDNINDDTAAILNVKVVDCEQTGTNVLNLRATVAVNGWYENKKCLELLTKDQDEVYVRTQKFDVESVEILPATTSIFTFNNEARVPIDKIIDTCVKVCVNNTFSSERSCRIEGEVSLDLAFVSDNGLLMCQTFSNMFSTEIMSDSIDNNTNLAIEAYIESNKINLSDGDNRAICSETIVRFCPSYMENRDIEGVVDAYSTEKDVKLLYQEIVLDKEFCLNSSRDKISSNVKIVSGLSNVECIINAHLEGSSIIHNNDGLYAEGLLIGDVIYCDEDGDYMSLKAEIPYSSLVAKSFECDDDIKLKDLLLSTFARVRTANEIEISAEMKFEITGKQTKTLKLVGNIEIGECKEVDNIAISLYIVKPGQSLWEVAKDLNTTSEVLIDQNPEMVMPLKAGSKILLYKKL
ncbi:MAG: LysM domain-containing protein [Clostridia bacterium]